jgi:hypothetical protein
MKTTRFIVAVSFNVEVWAVNEAGAVEIASELEMPRDYITDSFEATVIDGSAK